MILLDKQEALPLTPCESITVSAIVPVYNVLPYLRQCLDSLLRQNLPGLEIILVDDGSTDGSSELVDSYAARHALIRAFRKPNGGLSDARNYGLDHARGEYVAFVDSDDWLEDDALEKLYRRAIDTGAEVVACGGFRHLAQSGSSIRWGRRGPANTRFGVPVKESPWILFASQSYACNKIFKQSLLHNNGHRFPVGRWFEDSALIYNVMADANKVEFVDEYLYHYRYGREGAITSASARKTFDIFHSCEDFLSFLEAKKIDHPEMPAVLETLACGHILFRFDTLLDSTDRKLVREFIDKAFGFLDIRFPGWRERYALTRGQRFSWKAQARKNKTLSLGYLYLPSTLKKLANTPPQFSLACLLARRREKRALNRQRHALRQNGPFVLKELDRILSDLGVDYFADFGTLLGLVREGGFMRHDTDLDLGVLTQSEEQIELLRKTLQENGCTLWRSYSYEGKVAEQSYYFPCEQPSPKLKFDINYYRTDGASSHTFLFYREPGQNYLANVRSAVKMTYSPIRGTKRIERLGLQIPIPADPEQLLTEKYGPNWRVPDRSWIYWQSPAASKMPERSFFATAWQCGNPTGLRFDAKNIHVWEEIKPAAATENGLSSMIFESGRLYQTKSNVLRARKNLAVLELPSPPSGREQPRITLQIDGDTLRLRPHPESKQYWFTIIPAVENASRWKPAETDIALRIGADQDSEHPTSLEILALYILPVTGIFSRYCVNAYRKWKSRVLMRRLRWTIADFPCSHIDGMQYLAEHEDARSAVLSGKYATGAHHYHAVGRALGRRCPVAIERGTNVGTRSDLIAWEKENQR